MLCNHDGFSFGFPSKECLLQFFDGLQIQIGGWLVQHHHLWAQCGNRGAGDFLLFAAGQLEDTASQKIFNLQLFCCCIHTGMDFIFRNTHIFTAESKLAGSIYAEELTSGVLKHTAYKFCRFIQLCFRHIQTIYHCKAFKLSLVEMGNQTIDQSGDGGFSTTGFATKQDTFSISNGQGNIF